MLFEFRQAEIQSLSLFTCGYENVRRLDVPVRDALRVRRIQRVRDLNGEVKQFVDGEGGTCPLTRPDIVGTPSPPWGGRGQTYRRLLLPSPSLGRGDGGEGLRNPLPQRLSLQQLHGDERLAIGFVDVVNSADVGVVQRRGRVGLAAATFQSLGVSHGSFRQELQGNQPAAAWCPRPCTPLPCRRHPAFPEHGSG